MPDKSDKINRVGNAQTQNRGILMDLVPSPCTSGLLEQLSDSLRSGSADEHRSALMGLQQVGGPEAVKILSDHIEEEVQGYLDATWANRRRDGEDGVSLMLSLMLMVLGLFVAYTRPGIIGWLAGATCVFFGGILILRWRIQSRESAQRATQIKCSIFSELESASAVIALEPVCRFLRHSDKRIQLEAKRTAADLIKAATEEQLMQLGEESTERICSALIYENFGEPSLQRDAAFKALAAAGTEIDLARIEAWIKYGREATPSEDDSLWAFRTRIHQESVTNSLLRPSEERESERLLRPASLASVNPEMLLRPATSQNPNSPDESPK